MANQPRNRRPAAKRPDPVNEHGETEPVVPTELAALPEDIYQPLTEWANCDTFSVLVAGGNYWLEGRVPVKPVKVDGALFTWWQTGGCPWAEVHETLDVTLKLANIVMSLAHTAINEDGTVVVTPAAHVWADGAAWLMGSDGSETAVPRG